MYPRTNYEMTEEDLKELLDSCKPTPVMYLSGGTPIGNTPHENANSAWRALGEKMGFDWESVRPIPGKGNRFFSAVPSETETQRMERGKRESEEKRLIEIKRLEDEISDRQSKLSKLRGMG